MTEQKSNSYDETPYPGSPFPQTHPDRLATIGTLFGMRPASPERCRVLELGCTDGGNLIPMAMNFPGSEFVGVDFSGVQASKGAALVESLGLKNIRIEHRNILDVGPQDGKFDYIITHGIMSWVPEEVQKKILDVSRDNLKPQGVAYISYNTYPGWHMRGMLRDMMLYHTRQFPEIGKRIEQARALIQFLAESVPTENNVYGMLLKAELDAMKSWRDSYIRHEALEDWNEPWYFYQFAEMAQRHGLRYLGEAGFQTMLSNRFASKTYETLKKVGRDIIEMEQYMDFLRNRMFRQTLLCHPEVELKRDITPASLQGLYVSAPVRPETPPGDVTTSETVKFLTPTKASVSTSRPLEKAVFLLLHNAWPKAISVDELPELARSQYGIGSHWSKNPAALAQEAHALRDSLLQCYCDQIVELHAAPVPCTTKVADRPRASELAQRQAADGMVVTNQRHAQIKLDIVQQHILANLNGERDAAALLDRLIERVQDGTIVAKLNDAPIEDPAQIRKVLSGQVDVKLKELAKAALLVG